MFFADCENGERFFINEEEVLSKRQSVSQNEKSKWLDEVQLVEICREAIQARIGESCTFGSAHLYRAAAGRTVITLDFAAGGQSKGGDPPSQVLFRWAVADRRGFPRLTLVG